MTLRGQILVSRTGDDTALPFVCPVKTSPCMPAPCAHVERCKACNVYRAAKQSNFWSRTQSVPRPCADEVISSFRKKRQHNKNFEKRTLSLHLIGQSLTVIWGDSLSLCILKLKVTVPTLNNPFPVPLLLKSVSSVTEVGMFRRSRTFVAWMARATLDPAKGVVNTQLCVTGRRAPLRSNLDDPEEWELPCSVDESVCWDEAHRTEPVACCQIIKCGTTGCTGSCPLSVMDYGFSAGKEPRAGFVWEDICAF